MRLNAAKENITKKTGEKCYKTGCLMTGKRKKKKKPKQNLKGGGGTPSATEISHTGLKMKVEKIPKTCIPCSAKIPPRDFEVGSPNTRPPGSSATRATQNVTQLRKITPFLAALLCTQLALRNFPTRSVTSGFHSKRKIAVLKKKSATRCEPVLENAAHWEPSARSYVGFRKANQSKQQRSRPHGVL